MSEIIENKIEAQAKHSRESTLLGKPANDILNGRDSFSAVEPVRAIWEMVQNARDVSRGESEIVFIRKQDEFVFQHDGLPFDNDTLNALILQTSSKSRLDGDQVGQYGTGFLATHKMGRVFNLKGSLKLLEDEELYYNFPKLVVDRSPDTRDGMVEKLNEQFEETARWREDQRYRSCDPDRWTVFSYQQPNAIERKNTEDAFRQALDVVPYVLALNESIKSIVFDDEVDKESVGYIRGEKQPIKDLEYSKVYVTPVTVQHCGAQEEIMKVLTLESKQSLRTKKGIELPMATVILPVSGKSVIQIPDTVARLFIYLPLVGTEKWGINFIIHSPMFSCSSDNRSSLRLVKDGQTENDPAVMNQYYIQNATDMIFEYIEKNVRELTDLHNFAPVAFDLTSQNHELSNYYKELKDTWLARMQTIDIVSVETEDGIIFKKPREVFVLSEDLTNEVENNARLLGAFYRVLCNMHKDSIPEQEHLVYWSRVFREWYDNDESAQIIDIERIIEYVSEVGLSGVQEDDLLLICKYLKDSGQLKYFDQNILPTESGMLTNKKDGLQSDSFGKIMKEAIRVLLPKDTCRFVKDRFAGLIGLPLYTDDNIKTAISQCTSDLQSRIKTVTDWAKSPEERPQPEGLLSKEEREALMDYCRLFIAKEGEAFETECLELIREYYDYAFDFDEVADADALEWRGAIRTLLCNVLTEFTLLDDSDKCAREDWIKRLVGRVFRYADYADILQNFRVYLSQSGAFQYCKDLKKDAGIPEAMKDIYNAIVSTVETPVEVRDELFAPEFGMIAKTEAVWEVVVFGNDIMNRIQSSGNYLDKIDSYEHKNQVIDIINHFEGDDAELWKSAFPTIYSDIPALLAKLVLNDVNREPMIKIMKVKDTTRLNKVAEIIDNEHLDEIWKLGQDAWISKRNDEADFAYKKKLGEYVEAYLTEQLGEELSRRCSQLDVTVDDIQGGQDIIISIDGKPVYYIEVKSRWIDKDSVMMSALQLERSVDEKERYSLFAVNMIDFDRENVREHVYPKTMEEFVSRVKVMEDIGKLNEEIIPTKRNPNKQVHIGGDYKAVVPQDLIAEQGVSYGEFMEHLLLPAMKRIIESHRESILDIEAESGRVGDAEDQKL